MDKRINDDSREKLEADIADYFACWFGGGENTRAAIIGWLDRQAAITTRECDKPNWEYCDTCERIAELEADKRNWQDGYYLDRISDLEAKLEVYDETHMLLPVDADGVPIRVGDKMLVDDEYEAKAVMAVGDCNCWAGYDGNLRYADESHHVKPRTIEDVLLAFSERVCKSGHQWGLDAPDVVSEYAAELRELMG